MPKIFTLNKQQRLKSRKLIEEIFSGGQRISVYPYRIFYLFEKKEAGINGLQCGVGAGTRNFKKAVDRNRIKRLTREAYRLQKSELEHNVKLQPYSLALFFIYTGKELPAFDFVKEKVAIALKKLIIIADENLAANS